MVDINGRLGCSGAEDASLGFGDALESGLEEEGSVEGSCAVAEAIYYAR